MSTFRKALASLALATLCACAGLPQDTDRSAREALAPTGKLRVAFVMAPAHAVKDPGSGELKGPAIDLGRELARRLGVPFEPVAFSAVPALLAGIPSGGWDVAMMGITPERAQAVEFSPPYLVVEFGYLAAPQSRVSSLPDIDRPGVRIAVLEKSSPDVQLSRTVRNATLVRMTSLGEVLGALAGGKSDVIYASKATVLGHAEKLPGSRVIADGGGEETALAIPRSRPAVAGAYLRQFVKAAKSEGLVEKAITRAGVRGVVVARQD
jgi:polar amino acid transport system substrate-binding protein